MLNAACYVARLYEIYPMSKESKEIKNSHITVDLRDLSLISKESKVHPIDIMLQLYSHVTGVESPFDFTI